MTRGGVPTGTGNRAGRSSASQHFLVRQAAPDAVGLGPLPKSKKICRTCGEIKLIKKEFPHSKVPYGNGTFYHLDCKTCWNKKMLAIRLSKESFVESSLPLISELPSLDIVEKDNGGVERSRLHEVIGRVLDSLTLRERRAILGRYFYGLSFWDIGKEFNVTKERARQICVKALRKLCHPSRSNLLREFADGCPDTQVFDERRFWRIGKSVMPKRVRKSR